MCLFCSVLFLPETLSILIFLLSALMYFALFRIYLLLFLFIFSINRVTAAEALLLEFLENSWKTPGITYIFLQGPEKILKKFFCSTYSWKTPEIL